jgi:hypothetical protein
MLNRPQAKWGVVSSCEMAPVTNSLRKDPDTCEMAMKASLWGALPNKGVLPQKGEDCLKSL